SSAPPGTGRAMLGAPIVVAATAYVIHVARWGGGRLSHVPDFMFNPATERPWQFVARNTVNLVAIAVPGGSEFIAGIYNVVQVMAIVTIGAVALAGVLQLRRARAPRLPAGRGVAPC